MRGTTMNPKQTTGILRNGSGRNWSAWRILRSGQKRHDQTEDECGGAVNSVETAYSYGQSIWLDNLSRDMIQSGRLESHITNDGIRGITSNPAIFHKAITGSDLYDDQIRALAATGVPAESIYHALVIQDIRDACDAFLPLYEQSKGSDGFVSLEVSPHYAYHTDKTIDEAMSLHAAVDRANLMIKVPATEEGLPAIHHLLYHGININITLLFSIGDYEQVARTYIRAIEDRIIHHRPVDTITSVASFFLSRIDVLVDELLSHRLIPGDYQQNDRVRELMGKAAVANAKLAFQKYKRYFQGSKWQNLASKGAKTQRLLWASTSTKNENYSDVMYIEPLIAEDSVSTMPESTLTAFEDHGEAKKHTIENDLNKAGAIFTQLSDLGIDMDFVTQQLLNEGIQKFIEPYDKLKQSIAAKRQRFIAKAQGQVHQKW